MYKFEADFKTEKLKFSIFDKQIDFCFCSKTKVIYKNIIHRTKIYYNESYK